MKRGIIWSLVVIVASLPALSSWGQVTVPYTFTAGTTAKASEVNANFNALVKALPGLKTTTFSFSTTTISSNWTSMKSLSITAPSNGYCLVRVFGVCQIGANGCWVGISDDGLLVKDSFYQLLPANSTYPCYAEYPFTVSQGIKTFYFLAEGNPTTTITSFGMLFTVEFFPTSY